MRHGALKLLDEVSCGLPVAGDGQRGIAGEPFIIGLKGRHQIGQDYCIEAYRRASAVRDPSGYHARR